MPVIVFKDFSGGINNRYRSNRIADNEIAAARNSRWNRFGALSKRLGTTRIVLTDSGTPISGAVFGLFSYYLSTMAAEQLILADNSGNLWRTTSLPALTSLATGLNTTFEPNFEILNDLVFYTNSNDEVRSINASNTVTNISAAPPSRYIAVHKGYLFFFNAQLTPNPSRLQWSARNDGTTYVSTNFEDVNKNDGYYGSGMVSFGDELILFKGPFFTNQSYQGSSMYAVLGDTFDATNPTYSIVKIPLPPNVGVVHGRTAKVLNGVLIFATNDGFYAYRGGGVPPEPISEKIRGNIDNWETADAYSPTRRATAVVFKNKYLCSIYDKTDSSDGANNRVFVYEDGKWLTDIISSTADSFALGSGAPMAWSIFNGTLYSSSSNLASIMNSWETSGAFKDVLGDGTDGNVNFSVLTKEFDLGKEVFFKKCFVHLRRQSSGTLTFEVNVNQRGAVSSSVSMSSPDTGTSESSSSNVLRKGVDISKTGRTIQFRMHDLGNNDLEIYAIELHYDDAEKIS